MSGQGILEMKVFTIWYESVWRTIISCFETFFANKSLRVYFVGGLNGQGDQYGAHRPRKCRPWPRKLDQGPEVLFFANDCRLVQEDNAGRTVPQTKAIFSEGLSRRVHGRGPQQASGTVFLLQPTPATTHLPQLQNKKLDEESTGGE